MANNKPDISSLPFVSMEVENILIFTPSIPFEDNSFNSYLAAKSKYFRFCSCFVDCCRSMYSIMYFGFALAPGGNDKF